MKERFAMKIKAKILSIAASVLLELVSEGDVDAGIWHA